MSKLAVSVDLDDSWAYLQARNLPFRDAPSIIPLATARILELFDTVGIEQATVFVVGSDAQTCVGRDAIRDFVSRGWEIADHSYLHRGELAAQHVHEIIADLRKSQEAIAQVTGDLPNGFRCPSFGASPSLDVALQMLGYSYNASALPTPLMPLLRLYHRWSAGKSDHAPSYGNLATALGSLRPRVDHNGMSSIPTTTLPMLRTPFHGSYLMALANRSPALAANYAALADRSCRAFNLPISFLLHPTDVLDQRDAPQLSFFPGMNVPWETKRELLRSTLFRFVDNRMVATLARFRTETA